jgi:hypothetical protein
MIDYARDDLEQLYYKFVNHLILKNKGNKELTSYGCISTLVAISCASDIFDLKFSESEAFIDALDDIGLIQVYNLNKLVYVFNGGPIGDIMDKMEFLSKFNENFELRDLKPLPYDLDFILNFCAVYSSKEDIDSAYICPETLSGLTNGVFSPEEMSVIETMWEGTATFQQKRHIDSKAVHKVENALCGMPKNLARYKLLTNSLIKNSGDVYKTASDLYKESLNQEELNN